MTKRNRGFLKIVATDSSQHHFFPLPEDRLTASVKVRSICSMSQSFVVNCILLGNYYIESCELELYDRSEKIELINNAASPVPRISSL